MANPGYPVAALAGVAALILCTAPMSSASTGSHGGHPRAATPANSVALVSDGVTSLALATGLLGGHFKHVGSAADLAATDNACTAISPLGTTALVCRDSTTMRQLNHVTTIPKAGPVLDFGQFAAEGASNYTSYTEGAAAGEKFALVALAEQGVVQLRRTSGPWRIDQRVQSPGVSEAGTPHAPGFIRIPTVGPTAGATYDGVVVSSVPLKNGKYLGLAIDRTTKTLTVIDGVGTSHPKVAGQLTSDELGKLEGADEGNGGMAFSPATATRAVIATPSGLDVLDLTHPSAPTFLGQSVAVLPGDGSGIAIAPDGDHVALGTIDSVDTYSGLLHVQAGHTLKYNATVNPSGGSYEVFALAFVKNGTLVANHAGNDTVHATTGYYLSLIKGVETKNPVVTKTVQLDGHPDTTNTLSVTPALNIWSIQLAHPRAKVGQKFAAKLSVAGGIGHYAFTVAGGHLPKGLHRHGARITGTPKHAGKAHFTVRAVNQYGGAAFHTLHLKVH
jgi:hypothetical protein